MVMLELAAGILPGVVIVFSGVWMALYWSAIGASHKRALSVAMATSLIVVLTSFLHIASATVIIVVAVVLAVTVAIGLARGSNDNARPLRTLGPDAVAKMLYKPLACFFGIAAVLSTVAFFATMQRGPQSDPPIFELSGIAAACWALIMVGGVWARKNIPPSRNRARRPDAANRYGQSPFRKFPG